jgi:hypothetical protein
MTISNQHGPRPATAVAFAAAIAAVLALALVAGCSAPATPTPPPVQRPASGGLVPAPGLTCNADGTGVAFGYVEHVTLEGGFWALVAEPASAEASGATAIVVLLPGKVPQEGIAALDGSYVRASGAMKTGVSTRMAGPEMTVDAITALAPNKP